ncbi:hypothetical protein WI25_32965 [Burkholderia cepacia]|uniref:hypothetical protein n=1 Tax=Burkholderia cepacia TaxID=292 RepID=UPI000757A976|nr:hypothetical protein [Burkholderia cepacia]KUY87674.1 hypothetical protein WI25_32965 [Burkholderia cepacia]
MVLRHSAGLPARVTASRTLLDALGQRFGAAVFTLAQCYSDARSPLELARLQDQLQAGVRDGMILPDVGPGSTRGYRLAPDTWASVQRRLARAANQAALAAAEQGERERVLKHAQICDAIALLERHGYRVIDPDPGEPTNG